MSQMQQVLMNLVLNAAESLETSGGVVSVATGSMLCDAVYFEETVSPTGLEGGLYVFAEISDTGCGMDAETREKIFDPFFSTKQSGRGLGLAAVLGIVRGHQGAVRVHSEPGRGTSIKVLFPAGKDSVVEEQMIASASGEGGGRTVLFVDDETAVSAVGREVLASAGFQVIVANDGQEAVEVFASRDDIDVVVLDMMMPRMSGVDTFTRLCQLNDQVRVVLSSGYSEQEVPSELMGPNLRGFLQKPYRIQDLVQMVNDALPPAGNE
jgi:CheY-like chemotaxis protein